MSTLNNVVLFVLVLFVAFVPVGAEAQRSTQDMLQDIREAMRRTMEAGCIDTSPRASARDRQYIDNLVNAIRIDVEGLNKTSASGRVELTVRDEGLIVDSLTVESSHTSDGVNHVDLAGQAAIRFLERRGGDDTFDRLARDTEELFFDDTRWAYMMTSDSSSMNTLFAGTLSMRIRHWAFRVRAHDLCSREQERQRQEREERERQERLRQEEWERQRPEREWQVMDYCGKQEAARGSRGGSRDGWQERYRACMRRGGVSEEGIQEEMRQQRRARERWCQTRNPRNESVVDCMLRYGFNFFG